MRLLSRPSDAERASRYWSALVAGAPQTEVDAFAQSLDPTVVDATAQVRAMRTEHRPRPAFAARLERDLLATFNEAAMARTRSTDGADQRGIGGESASPRAAALLPRAYRRRLRLNELATAALLALTVFGVYATFVSRPFAPGDGKGRTPAAGSTGAAIDAGLSAKTLTEFAIPAGTLANGEHRVWDFEPMRILPGEAVAVPAPDEYCPSLDLAFVYVQSGTMTARATSGFEVIRAPVDASPAVRETVPPSVSVSLSAGDAAAISSSGASPALTVANPTEQTIRVINLQWFNECENAASHRYTPFLAGSFGSQPEFDQAAPLTLRYTSVTVQPGTVVPMDGPLGPGLLPADAAAWQVVRVESGVADQVYVRDGVASDESSTVRFWANSMLLPPPSLPEGVTVEVRNSGSEPLILTMVTITPAPA
jgi:hypothetical protein